jgi:hypothetical protein
MGPTRFCEFLRQIADKSADRRITTIEITPLQEKFIKNSNPNLYQNAHLWVG